MSWLATLRNNVFVRLTVYYALWIVALVILFRAFPIIPEYMDAERSRHIRTATGLLGSDDVDLPGFAVGPGALAQMSLVLPITLSMVVAFALSLPIAWLYSWTRQGKKYNPLFAQTLVIIPIAIALVVFLVKGSLALAFSLAGIVAAVRFRTTLSEPVDATYLFVSIGVGLASGVQLLPVAAIGSWCFVATVLLMWRTKLGVDPPQLVGWQLQPANAMSGSGHMGGQETEVRAGARNVLLSVQATDPGAVRQSIERALDTYTKRWHSHELSTDSPVLLYEVRLNKGVSPEELVSGVQTAGGAHITHVDVSTQDEGRVTRGYHEQAVAPW